MCAAWEPSSRRRCSRRSPPTGDPALIVVISGPGGVGKGTLVSRLLRGDHALWLSRSWTTRPQRPGEPADAYVFVDDDAFAAAVDRDEFLEHATFLGHAYGTPWPSPPEGRDVLLEIDVQGAAQVHRRHPEALLVFLLPPSHEEQLRRLRGRGDPEERVQQRVAKAADEEAVARSLHAAFVVNDDLDRATAEVQRLIDDARSHAQAARA